jgi:hypothetical protein
MKKTTETTGIKIDKEVLTMVKKSADRAGSFRKLAISLHLNPTSISRWRGTTMHREPLNREQVKLLLDRVDSMSAQKKPGCIWATRLPSGERVSPVANYYFSNRADG